jgi:hypothetical protein
MWPCHTEPSKQPIPYSPIIVSNRDRFRVQVFRFSWLSWVFLHDSGGLLVPTIICFLSASASYSFHICFRKYLFSYLFPVFPYSFLLPHKNMKTNVATLSSVRFRSVFIPRSNHRSEWSCQWRHTSDMHWFIHTSQIEEKQVKELLSLWSPPRTRP